MTSATIELDATTPDVQGVERRPLVGTYTAEILAEELISRWVPYFECHKCGRFDYCKFAEPWPTNPNRGKDIRCGVAATALRNLIHRCFDVVVNAAIGDHQHFLDGAYHFTRLVLEAEIGMGTFLDPHMLDYYGKYVPLVFGRMVTLRTHLDAFSHHMARFNALHARRSILLVEGWSEKKFLERLKASRLASLLRVDVKTYAGRDNSRFVRMHLLLDEYKAKGITVHIQGDADGKSASRLFDQLIARGLVRSSDVFVFEHDFESSIPAHLLYAVLERLGELPSVSLDQFVDATSGPGPIAPKLRALFGVETNHLKVLLAETLADLLNETWGWWDDEVLKLSELGRFLEFVQKMD